MLDMERLLNDANNGVLPALKFLGDVYLDGYEENDIEPDLEKAIECYEKAADGGDDEAMMELGYLYCSGERMQPDYEKGITYYKRAADKGNATAMGNLGVAYCKGKGVEADEKVGFSFFLQAAKCGHPDAMMQVSQMYRDGYGVEKDEEQAIYWEDKAKKQKEIDEKEANSEQTDAWNAFEENLKFISRDSMEAELVHHIFDEESEIEHYTMGECEFSTGKVITADPLCYLQDAEDIFSKEKTIAPGKYPVQLAVMHSALVGLRIVGARLKVNSNKAVRYELAHCFDDRKEEGALILPGYPVECGMGCFCDEQAAKSYWKFLKKWYKENKDGNIYDDYFAALFEESYKNAPEYQRKGGDVLMWNNPLDGTQIAMFATGLGDGFYCDYWGVDEQGEICELVVVFMNPELF